MQKSKLQCKIQNDEGQPFLLGGPQNSGKVYPLAIKAKNRIFGTILMR